MPAHVLGPARERPWWERLAGWKPSGLTVRDLVGVLPTPVLMRFGPPGACRWCVPPGSGRDILEFEPRARV